MVTTVSSSLPHRHRLCSIRPPCLHRGAGFSDPAPLLKMISLLFSPSKRNPTTLRNPWLNTFTICVCRWHSSCRETVLAASAVVRSGPRTTSWILTAFSPSSSVCSWSPCPVRYDSQMVPVSALFLYGTAANSQLTPTHIDTTIWSTYIAQRLNNTKRAVSGSLAESLQSSRAPSQTRPQATTYRLGL